MKNVLFVCVENAGRSQMAEAFANLYGKGLIYASSAGTMPSSEVHPVVIEVMKEKGIDLSKNRPKPVDARMVQEADVIIVRGVAQRGSVQLRCLRELKIGSWRTRKENR